MHEYDLLEIKREIVEGRSLSIKTNNLVNALAADIKSISKRQLGYERRMMVHSTAAYIVTTLVILGLSKVALDAQVAAVRAESQNGSERIAALEKTVTTVETRSERRNAAIRQASEVYALLERGDERTLLEKLPSVLTLELSPVERKVLESAGNKARRSLARSNYQAGVEHFARGRYHEAAVALRDSLDLEYDSPDAPQAMFQLARAYRALEEQKKAIVLLVSLTEASSNADVLDDATWLLAQCQAEAELWNDAKATLRLFLRRFDKSPFRDDAKRLAQDLDQKH
jgi:TolA-binding protein